MKRVVWLHLSIAAGLLAEEPVLIFDRLPQPLKLPPGLEQTLPLNRDASFFGEAIRAVDCPDPKDWAYGLCGNQLFGGLVMGDSHLSGTIHIRFSPPVDGVSHFVVTHGTLTGEDAVIAAPQGYELPLLEARVFDAPPGLLCQGDLELTTGGVANLQYRIGFMDSAIAALGNVNPRLGAVTFNFPGIRGHAYARFDQRPDGLLDYTFRGSTFMPLGGDAGGDPIRFPLPLCPKGGRCADIPARGTAFHPHLYLSTREPGGTSCGANCPEIPFNTIREYTVFTHSSSFGDDFRLDIPQLGGMGAGRSHLQGRLQIQFGPKSGNTVPFAITSLVPAGLFAKAPESDILGPGPAPGLVGQEEILAFPSLTYRLQRVVFVDEPYDIQHGAIDLRTGRVIGDMVYPAFYGQSLADVLFRINSPRISKEPFYLVARTPAPGQVESLYALFEKGPNGGTLFRFSGEHKRSFATYLFPLPDLVADRGFLSGPAGALDLFLRLQAADTSDVAAPARKTGAASDVLSSLGDRFSYSYSMPCNAPGESFSFEYTNNNSGSSGGSFRMKRLAAASCSNSRTSSAAPDFDTVTFSGFGTWSKDASDAKPRFASVQISTDPLCPYAGILIYQDPDADGNVIRSSANTKPAERPLP